MPLKLQIGLNRKIGQPHYSSRGATVALETEENSDLVDQPHKLHERLAQLFRLARQSIEQELGRPSSGRPSSNGREPRPATPAQVQAIHAIARRQNMDLIAELRGRFGFNRPDDLSVEEAGQMIDVLQRSPNERAAGTKSAAERPWCVEPKFRLPALSRLRQRRQPKYSLAESSRTSKS